MQSQEHILMVTKSIWRKMSFGSRVGPVMQDSCITGSMIVRTNICLNQVTRGEDKENKCVTGAQTTLFGPVVCFSPFLCCIYVFRI